MRINYRIPFGNLKIGEGAKRRVNQILDSNWISEGRFVREFEEKFAEKFGYKHAIATSSGTTAGQVVMCALRERMHAQWAYDNVITPACAFVATANCILTSGLIPKFVDVELDSLNMNPQLTGCAIDHNTIAIQFVLNMGRSISLDKVQEIADSRCIPLVVDACEGHGATLNGKQLSEYGLVGIYSFYTAHLIVCGEGGMIGTNDDTFADLCRSIKSHGRSPGNTYFDFQKIGINAKPTDLAAAIGLEALDNFDATLKRRLWLKHRIFQLLVSYESANVGTARFNLYPDIYGEQSAPHAFPIVLRDSNADARLLYNYMDKAGIQVKNLFGSLPTNHAAFEFLGHSVGEFPIAERLFTTGLHFGLTEYMSDDDPRYIVDTIRRFFDESEQV